MGDVSVRGAGAPGETVEIVANGQIVGTTQIDENGRWRFGIQLSNPGIYALGARTIDEDGTLTNVAMPAFLLVSDPTATPKPTRTPVPTATIAPTSVPEPTEAPAGAAAPDDLPPTGASSMMLGLRSFGAAGGVLLLLAGYVGLASVRRRRRF
jgi:hypothetical protein